MKLKNIAKKGELEKTAELFEVGAITYLYMDLLLDQAVDVLAYIDINLRYLHVNNAYAASYGLHKGDVIGKYVSEILPEAAFKLALPWFIKAFQGEYVKFYNPAQSPSSEITLIPHFEHNTDVTGCICVVRALPKFNENQNKQLTNHQEFINFFNLSLDLLCISNIEGLFLRLSHEWEKILGFGLTELENHHLLDFVCPDDVESTKAVLLDLKSQKPVVGFSNRCVCKDGTYRWIEWHAYPNGNYIYATARDVTKRVNSEESLKASEAKLRDLNTAKDRFFSIISHDLKSPFNNILGFAELLYTNLDAYDKELTRQIAGQLYTSSKMAFDLLENLLEWSSLQTNRTEFEPSHVDFNELFNEYLPVLQIIASSKEIVIETNIPPDLIVFVDINLTKTVIRNLISNAVKFSNSLDNIIVEANKSEGYAHISIIDHGIGIPAHNLDKLFRIDTKYSTLGTMNERGTGLGLILCKDLVEKQGGSISVISDVGKGSKFTFTLPL